MFVVCFFLFFFKQTCFRLVCLSFCIYNRTKHIYKQNNNITTRRNTLTNTYKTKQHKYPSQALRDIYFSRRFVGWKSCISVFLLFFEFVCLFSLFSFVVFVFSPSLFKLLHLQSKNTYNNRTNINKLEGKHKTNRTNNINKTNISQPDP